MGLELTTVTKGSAYTVGVGPTLVDLAHAIGNVTETHSGWVLSLGWRAPGEEYTVVRFPEGVHQLS